MKKQRGDTATGVLVNPTFHDLKPIFYSSLKEEEFRLRFGEVERAFVDRTRHTPAIVVITGLHYVRTLAGAYRIWRAERRGRNRRDILEAADRRIIALEEVH